MGAIIFDFDGVIVDSEPVHAAALRECLRAEGLELTDEEYASRYLGLCDRDIIEGVYRSAGRRLGAGDLASLMARKRILIEEAIAQGACVPYEASGALLREAARVGPAAICSGAMRHEIDAVLRRLGLEGVVQVITSAEETAKSKPDPAPYLLTVERLGVPARACVAIEDTAHGISSAKVAGLAAVGVCHSMRREELEAAGADLVAASTADLTVQGLLALIEARTP